MDEIQNENQNQNDQNDQDLANANDVDDVAAAAAALDLDNIDDANMGDDFSLDDEPELPNPVVFQRRPTVVGTFDFTNKGDMKVYDEATKPAYNNFSVEPNELHGFVQAVGIHAKMWDWVNHTESGILHIPELIYTAIGGKELGTKRESLLEKYGAVTYTRVKTWVESWINNPSRAVQDDSMLFVCLYKSLSKEGLSRLYAKADKYTINDHESGTLFLKVILDTSSLTSNVTIMRHKRQLTKLVELLAGFKWDIEHFNMFVRRTVLTLRQHGSDAPELLYQLFPAFLACPDKTFNAYIVAKQFTFEDGTETITAEGLMNSAEHKYAALKDGGDWKVEEEEITALALSAKIVSLERKVVEATRKRNRYDRDDRESRGNKGKPKDKSRDNRKRSKPDTKWKYEAPKAGGEVTMQRGTKTFHWCSIANGAPTGHGCDMWTVHKPHACKGFTRRADGAAKSGRKSNSRQMQVQQAEIELSDSE